MQQFLSDHHNDLRILLLIETIKGSNINIALSYHSTIIAQHWVFFISNSQHWNIFVVFTCPGPVVCPNGKVRIWEAFKISNWGNQLCQKPVKIDWNCLFTSLLWKEPPKWPVWQAFESLTSKNVKISSPSL